MTHRPSESGNVLFFILIAVVLFAALSFAVSKSNVGTKDITDEKAKMYASEIIAQGGIFQEAVSKLRLRGITENNISFENTTIVGYTNTNCTIDECKIFQQAGGGISWQTPPQNSQSVYTNWGFSATKAVSNAGLATAYDLMAILPNLSKTVCEQINLALDNSGSIINANTTLDKFTGTYGAIPGVFGTYQLKPQGCVQMASLPGTATTGAATNSYAYFHVILPR